MARRKLIARPLDLFYVAFLLLHLPASVFVDFQTFYPPQHVPGILRKVFTDYLAQSADPLLSNAFKPDYAWFSSFIVLEALFQVPCFVMGAWLLFQDNRTVYPLLLAYGASSATTTLACLATVVAGSTRDTLTGANLQMILQSYVPFFLVPLAMAVDMGWRTTSLIAQLQRPTVAGKKEI